MNPALLTKQEFLLQTNPDHNLLEQQEIVDLFDPELKSAQLLFKFKTRFDVGVFYTYGEYGVLLDKQHVPIGVLDNDSIYVNRELSEDDLNLLYDKLGILEHHVVPSIDKYKTLIFGKSVEGEFPVLVQNLADGFQIREPAKKLYGEDQLMVVLDPLKRVVVYADGNDVSLLLVGGKGSVGKGLGQQLYAAWNRRHSDKSNTGGYSPMGLKMAIRYWIKEVKSYAASGGYTKAIKRKEISLEKVKQILSEVKTVEAGLSAKYREHLR